MIRLLQHRTSRCVHCEHPLSAASEAGLVDAARDHGEYIHQTVDRSTDPHYEDARLTELIER